MKSIHPFRFPLAGIVLLLAGFTHAQPVGLDQGFAAGGYFNLSDGATAEQCIDLVVQPDGKPVVLAETDYDPDEFGNHRIIVFRLNPDGTLDGSFGSGGKVYIDTPNASDVANAIALQGDGKILVASKSSNPWSLSATSTLTGGALFRLNTNGSMDNSFGTGGRAYIDGQVSSFRNVVVLPTGKIVVSGYGFVDSKYAYLVARFNTNGKLDITFNTGQGYNLFRSSTYSTEEDEGAGFGLAFQPDGKIITCGYDEKENGTAARLTTTGTLDNTFGYSGFQRWDYSEDVFLYSILVQPDGKIVFAGYYDYSSTINKAILIRVLPNGNGDTSFSSGASFDWYGNDFGSAFDVALQSDGKYVLAGLDDVIRVNPDSKPDQGFNGNGFYTLPLNGAIYRTGINLKLDGNYIYVVGYTISSSSDTDGFVARIFNNFTTAGQTDSNFSIDATLAPNPVSDVFRIQLDESVSVEDLMVDARNSSGQMMLNSQKIDRQNAEISVADWPNGVYFLRLTQPATGKSHGWSLIVQH